MEAALKEQQRKLQAQFDQQLQEQEVLNGFVAVLLLAGLAVEAAEVAGCLEFMFE